MSGSAVGVSPGVSRSSVFHIPEYPTQDGAATRSVHARAFWRAYLPEWTFENTQLALP